MRNILLFFLLFPGINVWSQNSGKWLAPACTPKLYGLHDEKGDVFLEAKYDFLYDQGENAWIAIYDGKWGVVNARGEWIVKPVYESIRQFRNGKSIVAKRVKLKASSSDRYTPNYAYRENDSVIRYGLVDEAGIWLIDATYEFIKLGQDGSVLYLDEYNNYGFLNSDGTVLIKAQYEYATIMSSGGAAIIGERKKNSASPYRYDYYNFNQEFKSGDYYIINRKGDKLNKDPYDLVREFCEGRAAFNKGGAWKNKNRYSDDQRLSGGKWGFVDENGTEVVPPKYDYVYDYENGKAKVQLGEKTFWIDKDGNETSPPAAQSGASFTVFCMPGSFGYIDVNGKWAIEPQFYAAHEFSEGLAATMALRSSDLDCEEPEYESEYLYSDYSGRRKLNLFGIGMRKRTEETESAQTSKPLRRLFGYIDATGVTVIEAKYEIAMPFHNNRAYVCFRGKWGIIDRKGNWIMQPVLESPPGFSYVISAYREALFSYYGRARSMYYYDDVGVNPQESSGNSSRTTDSPPYIDVYSFSEGMGVIYYSGKFGVVDTSGKVVVAPVYDYISPFSQGLAAVRHADRWGYVDKKGKEVIPLKYGSASSFSSNGLAAVSTTAAKSDVSGEDLEMVYEEGDQQYYGYIDKSGNWVIKPQFSEAGDFTDGLAVAALDYNGKGYIDKSGKFVIEPKYDYATNFSNGYAFVRIRMYEGVYIDKNGKVSKVYNLKKNPPDKTRPLSLHVNENGRFGFLNEKGEEAIPHQFRYAGEFAKVD